MIYSLRQDITALLQSRLPATRFEITRTDSDVALSEALRRGRPSIVVVDAEEGASRRARMAVSLTKSSCPNAKLIVLSRRSTRDDAALVEQGVFFYLCGSPSDALVRAVRAAAVRIEPNEEVGT